MATNTPTIDSSAADSAAGLLGGRRTDTKGLVFHGLLLVAMLGSLVILITLVARLLASGLHVFTDRGGDFISSGTASKAENAGLWQGLWGSAILGLIVIIVAFPMGIAAAIYLEEYAHQNRLTRFITVNVRNLAGVPSVVYGLLGLSLFVETFDSATGGSSVMSAGLITAILVLPIVIITASEAIRAVPLGIREAGFGVGATRWEVTKDHVLPYAAPGILTGTVLALARALGEAAPALLIGAVTGFFKTAPDASVIDQLQGKFTVLPVVTFDWSRKPDDAFRDNAAAASLLMLLIVLVASSLAIVLRNRYEKRR